MERADAHFVESGGKETIISRVYHEEAGGGTPEVPSTYKYTWISENGTIWGLPITDQTMLTLDAAGVAINEGGGIVSVPCAGHPFSAGDVLRFTNSVYTSTYTLTAGTTASRLHFATTFQAETFAGNEIPQKQITTFASGMGHLAQDSEGNLYFGHNWDATNGTYVTKILPDNTKVYDFLTTSWPIGDSASTACNGIAITPDDQYLYIYIEWDKVTDWGYVEKYELATGDLVWQSPYVTWPGYDMVIDADGNAYGTTVSGLKKFDNADGSVTSMTVTPMPYVVLVDNDLGIVLTAGTADLGYNLAVRTLDDTKGDGILLGDIFIATGCVAIYNGVIYALTYESSVCKIYKVTWDGSSLSLATSVTGPDYGAGLYVDLWGNIVAINQDWVTLQDDVLWFYDSDLNYLSKVEGMFTSTLRGWTPTVGGAWLQGDAVFNGELGTPEIPGTQEYWQIFDSSGSEIRLTGLIGEEVAILADGVVMPNQIVDDNGRIDCSAFPNVKKLHWGLAYLSKLKPMKPVSQPDMMKRRVTCKQMGLSVHNTDDIKYGVHDDDMKDINFEHEQWKNKSDIDGLFTGTVDVQVPDGFSVNLPLQITTNAPLPATVRAMIPKVDMTGA